MATSLVDGQRPLKTRNVMTGRRYVLLWVAVYVQRASQELLAWCWQQHVDEDDDVVDVTGDGLDDVNLRIASYRITSYIPILRT